MSQETRDEFHRLNEVRANVYETLAEFFRGQGTNKLVSVWPQLTEFTEGMEQIAGTAGAPIPVRVPAAIEIEKNLARLFYGVGEKTIPLVASAYTNAQHLVGQEDCRTLSAFYAKFGWSPKEELQVFADSLPVELGFLALLVRQGCARDQIELIALYLYPLVCTVSAAAKAEESGFVGEVLQVLKRLLFADKALLSQVIAES